MIPCKRIQWGLNRNIKRKLRRDTNVRGSDLPTTSNNAQLVVEKGVERHETNLSLCHCATVVHIVGAALPICQGIDEPKRSRRGPISAEVAQGVEQRHVSAADRRVAHFREEGHRRHEHAARGYLNNFRRKTHFIIIIKRIIIKTNL